MQRSSWPLSTIISYGIVCVAVLLLSACTLADQFGDRAVNYNLEAESARDQGLLLNVVRAAYRKPMQFTDLTTAAGTATATGTMGSSLLIGPHQSAASSNLSPGFTFAGGPTFTVNTLDNKEFYSGIMAPIDSSLINYFISIGMPKSIVYTLLIGDIHVDGATPPDVPNNLTDQNKWNEFQDGLAALLKAGLTIELKDPKPFGPRLTSQSLSDPAKLAALAKAKVDLVPVKSDKPGEPAFWNAVKGDPKPHFCFDRINSNQSVIIHNISTPIRAGDRCDSKDDAGNGQSEALRAGVAERTLLPGLSIRLRSLEGVIYFLGEIARSELSLDTTNLTPIKPTICFGTVDHGECSGKIDTLFTMKRGPQVKSIGTTYEEETYSMPVDPSNIDHSAQVLEFVTQLLALNSSSKDLPAPSIVTLIGH